MINPISTGRHPHYYWIVILAYLLCVPLRAISQNESLFSIKYEIEKETSATIIHQIKQDSLGLIWLATDRGILRFDGERYFQFIPPPSLVKSIEFFGIVSDHNNQLWFFNSERELLKFDYTTNSFIPSKWNPLLRNVIIGIPVDYLWESDTVFYLETAGLRAYKLSLNNGIETIDELTNIDEHKLFLIDKDKKNRDYQFGLIHLDSNEFKITEGDSIWLAIKVNKKQGQFPLIYYRFGKNVLSYIGDFLYILNENREIIYSQKTGNYPTPNGIFLDSEGSVWIGLFDKGLIRISWNQNSEIVFDTLIRDMTITNITSDYNGNGIWVSSLNNGFYHFVNLDQKQFYAGQKIRSINKLGQSYFSINESCSILETKETSKFRFEKYTSENLGSGRGVADLIGNELLLRSSSAFVIIKDEGEYGFSKYTQHRIGNPDFIVTGVNGFSNHLKLPQFNLDTATYISHKGEFSIHFPPEFRGIKFILSDNDENLTSVSYRGNIFHYSIKDKKVYCTKAPIANIKSLNEYKNNTYLITTSNCVLVWNPFDPENIDTLLHLSGLEINFLKIIANDTFLCTSQGVFKGIRSPKQHHCISYNYKTANTFDFWQDAEYILLSTLDGLFIEETSGHLSGFETSKPRIYSVTIDSKELLILDTLLKLPYNHPEIQFGWSNFEFDKTTRSNYRYRLNSNSNWTLSQSNFASFYSLSPNEYKFEVQLQNLNGTWTESASYAFRINPPWYQTTWFIITMIGLLGFSIYILFLLRFNYLKEKLDLREAALAAQNQALGAQLNPHFIFNSMNTVSSFIAQEDDTKALRYISKLSVMLRRIFANAQKSTISLAEELVSVRQYIEIEQLRFGEKLRFHLQNESTKNLEDIQVPSMLIQPFIENSIKHAILKNEEGGNIWLTIVDGKDSIKVIVEDDGPGFTDLSLEARQNKGESSISAIQKRLRIIESLGQESAKMSVEQGSKGAKITLTFSIKNA